jgi:chromatin segregation and condensation protein Rec8/ScpA/Scc1 (kleisin family)
MSTGAIVAIVVAAVLLLIVFAVLLPRMRARAEERRIASRRDEVAGAHREEASTYAARAEYAEREAQRERAEADLHEARARLHEQGLADDELDAEHGRLTGDEPRTTDSRDARFVRGERAGEEPPVDRPARS